MLALAVWLGLTPDVQAAFSYEPSATLASPDQPTDLVANHRSGQTFLTWTQSVDADVVRYRVYRHDQPIDATNLASAELISDAWMNSSRFYSDQRIRPDLTWETRYFDRYVIENGGPELSATTELLVWTLAEEDFGGGSTGTGYYAVTSVNDLGEENVADFTSANATGSVNENIATAQPVLGTLNLDGLVEVYIHYLDLRSYNPTLLAPNEHNEWFGFDPLQADVQNARQYAVIFTLIVPNGTACTEGITEFPLVLSLHGHGGQRARPLTFDPEPTWCAAYRLRPLDVVNTWWFGHARDHDYRTGIEVPTTETIANFTEEWVLDCVDAIRHDPVHGPKIDPERTFVLGHSMGGSGALAFALRYGAVFAAAHASQPMTDYETSGLAGGTNWIDDVAVKLGHPSDNLPTEFNAPNGYADHLQAFAGSPVWDWQDHQTQLISRRGMDFVPFGIDHGLLDTIIEWQTQGQPVYQFLDGSSICWAGEVLNVEHISSGQSTLPGALQDDGSGVPFRGWQARLHESLPGFSETSDASPLPPTAVTAFNDEIEWSATWNDWDGPPTDQPDLWQISLRTNDATTLTTRVTPRRLQDFEVLPGLAYRWGAEDIDTGIEISSGTIYTDEDGLLTTPALQVTPIGTRVTLEKSLVADVATLSISAGGTQSFDLALGSDLAGKLTWMLGSLTGTSPGIPVDGMVLPLVLDAYTQSLLSAPNAALLAPTIQPLAGDGRATSALTVPAGISSSLIGQQFHHAFAVIDMPGSQAVIGVSHPVTVELIP